MTLLMPAAWALVSVSSIQLKTTRGLHVYMTFPGRDGPINLIRVTNPPTCINLSATMCSTDVYVHACVPMRASDIGFQTQDHTYTLI